MGSWKPHTKRPHTLATRGGGSGIAGVARAVVDGRINPQTVLDQFDAWKHAYLQLRDERDRLRHERHHPVSRLIPLDANTYSRMAIRPV